MNVQLLIVLAATDPEDRGGLEVILPPAAELFWGAVAFALVYLLVAKLAFPKINELLEERAANIQGKMDEADDRLAEAEQTKSDYEQKVREAKDEAYRIVEDARESAESVRREIVERAEREAEQVLERAQTEIAAERDRTIQQLRTEVSRLAVQLAERIVQQELDESAHQELIDGYIEQLTTTNGDAANAGDRR